MSPKVTLSIGPGLLRWARESAGITTVEAADHFSLTEGKLSEWESEGASVTPNQLDRIAGYYKRPTAAFFLPQPPPEPPVPSDYRLFPNSSGPRRLGRIARLALRRARWLQLAYAEFGESRDRRSAFHRLRANLRDDITDLARRARDAMGVPVAEQKKWRRYGRGFTLWRERFEENGIPVFVFPVGADFRGCSLGGERAVILIGSGDYSPTGRTFTLFHEWCHLLLGQPGICEPEAGRTPRPQAQVEAFCNSFAGEFLVPRSEILLESAVALYRSGGANLDSTVSELATLYSVSRQVMLIRLHTERIVPDAQYSGLMRILNAPVPPKNVKMKGRTRAKRAVAQLGVHFVGEVLGAAENGTISYRDATDYLSIGMGDFDKVRENLIAM